MQRHVCFLSQRVVHDSVRACVCAFVAQRAWKRVFFACESVRALMRVQFAVPSDPLSRWRQGHGERARGRERRSPVDAFGMVEVRAGQHAPRFPFLELAQADGARAVGPCHSTRSEHTQRERGNRDELEEGNGRRHERERERTPSPPLLLHCGRVNGARGAVLFYFLRGEASWGHLRPQAFFQRQQLLRTGRERTNTRVRTHT